jgi:hypothetical protein
MKNRNFFKITREENSPKIAIGTIFCEQAIEDFSHLFYQEWSVSSKCPCCGYEQTRGQTTLNLKTEWRGMTMILKPHDIAYLFNQEVYRECKRCEIGYSVELDTILIPYRHGEIRIKMTPGQMLHHKLSLFWDVPNCPFCGQSHEFSGVEDRLSKPSCRYHTEEFLYICPPEKATKQATHNGPF